MKCNECQGEARIMACYCETCQDLVLPTCLKDHPHGNLCQGCLKKKNPELYLRVEDEFYNITIQNLLLVRCVRCSGTGKEKKGGE